MESGEGKRAYLYSREEVLANVGERTQTVLLNEQHMGFVLFPKPDDAQRRSSFSFERKYFWSGRGSINYLGYRYACMLNRPRVC